jgi:hypothetical protein
MGFMDAVCSSDRQSTVVEGPGGGLVPGGINQVAPWQSGNASSYCQWIRWAEGDYSPAYALFSMRTGNKVRSTAIPTRSTDQSRMRGKVGWGMSSRDGGSSTHLPHPPRRKKRGRPGRGKGGNGRVRASASREGNALTHLREPSRRASTTPTLSAHSTPLRLHSTTRISDAPLSPHAHTPP